MPEVVTPPVSSEETAPTNAMPAYNQWVKQVMERLVEDEKKWVELASEQSNLTMKAIRQSLEFYRTFPTPPVMGWIREGTRRFYAAQKLPTLGQETPPVEASAEKAEIPVARPPLEGLFEFRDAWLEFLTRQNRQFMDLMQEGMGLRGRIVPVKDGETPLVAETKVEAAK